MKYFVNNMVLQTNMWRVPRSNNLIELRNNIAIYVTSICQVSEPVLSAITNEIFKLIGSAPMKLKPRVSYQYNHLPTNKKVEFEVVDHVFIRKELLTYIHAHYEASTVFKNHVINQVFIAIEGVRMKVNQRKAEQAKREEEKLVRTKRIEKEKLEEKKREKSSKK